MTTIDRDLWQDRANHLTGLLTAVAELRHAQTTTYATAYLAAEGTAQAREQTARLAAADATLAAEKAAALVAGYRVRLDAWQATLETGAGDG